MPFSKLTFCSLLLSLLSLSLPVLAQPNKTLADSINNLAIPAKGHVGTYLLDFEAGDSCMTNGTDHFPMLSVFKFPLALYVLDQVDKGKLSLETSIDIQKSEWQKLNSPLLNKYPQEHISLTIREILKATVSSSDNAGCDLLFRLVGGTTVVDSYIHGLGIKDINIAYTEMQMASDWDKQYRNWSTPPAMGHLLYLFYTERLLSRPSNDLLRQFMTESTSPRRIQGKLPAGTAVAHKTGTSNTNAAGITAATNDVGFVTLPNGHHLIIVVYVADAKADDATRLSVISDIGLTAFTHYAGK
jgi:beta-lactamase class A